MSKPIERFRDCPVMFKASVSSLALFERRVLAARSTTGGLGAANDGEAAAGRAANGRVATAGLGWGGRTAPPAFWMKKSGPKKPGRSKMTAVTNQVFFMSA